MMPLTVSNRWTKSHAENEVGEMAKKRALQLAMISHVKVVIAPRPDYLRRPRQF
jgi:hypothetical protein